MEYLSQNPAIMLVIVLFVLFLTIGSGIYIGISIGLVGMVLFMFFIPGNTYSIQGMLQFNIMNSLTLCAVPLFIFMGEIMMRTGAGVKLYQGITPFVSYLPGGLLHANIASCAIFAALSGSSLATAATIAVPAIPELLDKRKYNPQLVLGSLAAGGTLGILIPPSINMIIYGAWTNNSIGTLYIAGIIPGILLSCMFMIYIAIRCYFQPKINPPREPFSLKSMIITIPSLIPSFCLIMLVLGTIYMGVATPTEAAALGVVGAIVISLIERTLKWDSLKESALGTIRTTAMITLIVVCAQMMSMSVSMLRLPSALADVISSIPLSRWYVFAAITIFYAMLGCVMEALSMMLLTLPVIYPIIIALEFDPIWFGIMITIFVEMAQITPPVGINLFIIQGISNRKFSDVAIGIFPFFGCIVIIVMLLCIFPMIALWLPRVLVQTY